MIEAGQIIPAFAPATNSSTLNRLGVSLRAAGNPATAVAAYRRALEREEPSPGLLSNFGNALTDLQRFDDALALHRRAVKLAPTSAQFMINFGVTLRDAGMIDEALSAFDRALFIEPDNVSARFNRAQLLLMCGDYRSGWAEFEWRWRLETVKPPSYRQPLWDGRDHPDGTILLWPEQGFGDTILCARFIPFLKRKFRRVLLGCQPALARLFSKLDGVDEVLPYGTKLPKFDVHCPLMSLARFLATDLQAIPQPADLFVPQEVSPSLQAAISSSGDRLRVGIVWSGSVTFKSNHLRSTSLERFLELTAVPGIQLFSLQKGPRAADLTGIGADRIVIDLAPMLNDFADTAAAISQLDLVVMSDSSVAHLCGSLGRPVWNLLHHVPYWLYLRNRTDSPWYPSMRLFRQNRPGDWDEVFKRVNAALMQHSRQHRSKGLPQAEAQSRALASA